MQITLEPYNQKHIKQVTESINPSLQVQAHKEVSLNTDKLCLHKFHVYTSKDFEPQKVKSFKSRRCLSSHCDRQRGTQMLLMLWDNRSKH